MKLRPYQQEAVDAVLASWKAKPGEATLVALPTGTGKSVVVAAVVQAAFAERGCRRALVLTHSAELVRQDFVAARQYWPEIDAGLYCAQLGVKVVSRRVTFASIQSYNRTPPFVDIDAVVIDEAHLVSTNARTMYRTALKKLRDAVPNLNVVGLTATPYRMTSGLLTSPGGLFKSVCYDRTRADAFVDMLNAGYLVRPEPRQADTQLDTRNVRIQSGEFVVSELEKAVDTAGLNERVVAESLRLLEGRRSVLVFCTGVRHAEHVAAVLREHGQLADTVHGGNNEFPLAKDERNRRISAFRDGRTRFLTNCQILTTGFDHPAIDALVVLRPTQSPGLWAQIVGRGLRPVYATGYPVNTAEERHRAIAASGKPDCIVLDFGGNIARLGEINNPKIPEAGGVEGRGPLTKECKFCGANMRLTEKCCPVCGTEYQAKPRAETTFDPKAAVAELVSEADIRRLEQHADRESRTILSVSATLHQRRDKPGVPPTLRVDYRLKGAKRATEYVCLDHPKGSAAHQHAARWWAHFGTGDAPSVANAAAAAEMDGVNWPVAVIIQPGHRFPIRGWVWPDGKLVVR